MLTSNDYTFASLAIAQQASSVWPDTANEWAALIAPIGLLLAALSWLVNHFIVKPLKTRITNDKRELSKNIRSLRRMTQTYVGKVDILGQNIRDCSATETENARKIAGVEARALQIEEQFREIKAELQDVKSLINYKIMDKLEEIAKRHD